MKTLIDGETFCRTCLCTTAEFHPLFAENLIKILKLCTSVDVDEHETIAMICRKCHSLLLKFWQFRLNSLEADAIVKSTLRVKSETTEVELKSEAQLSNHEYESEITTEIVPNDDQTDADIPKLDEPLTDEDIKPKIPLKRSQKPHRPKRNSSANSATKSIRFFKRTVQTSDDISCKICKKIVKNRRKLQRHILFVHTAKIPLYCDKCDKTFKHEPSLKRHMDHHNGIKSIPRKMCNICGLQFTNIAQHVTKMHENTQQRSFSCRFCQALFVDMSSLRHHSKTEHERERDAEAQNYECTLCGKKFRNSSNLCHHLKSQHSDKRPFACSVCNKRFKKKDHLTGHMRFHTDERPYPCDLCDRKFRCLTTMKAHRRIHTGEKPYVCNVCQKAFTQRTTMNTHMKVHNKF